MKRLALASLVIAAFVLAPMAPGEAGSSVRLQKMLLVLEEARVSVDFKEKPLPEVMKFLSAFTGVNLVIAPVLHDERDEQELEVSLTLKDVSVRTALNIILELKGVALVYRHGVLMVTTPKDARGKPVLRLYSIGDLTVKIRDFPAPELMLRPAGAEDFGNISGGEDEGREQPFADPEFIMDLVTENTGADTWEDDGVRISVNRRLLIVRTYPSVHRQIVRLLNMLRACR